MRAVTRRVAPLVVALLGSWVSFAQAAPQQQSQQQPQEQSQRIRVTVEVVPVDVQVLDRTGQPVAGLGPEKFTVTINGKRRRVISAEQIRSDANDEGTGPASGSPASTTPKRVIMLAVDCISFDATASREVIQSVAAFVKGLQPDDYVGLSAYPNGAEIAPTVDHATVLRALANIIGQRDGPGLGQFNLRPSEIVDASRDIPLGGGDTLDAVVARECGFEGGGPNCRTMLINEITSAALYYEGQSTASLGMLRNLVTRMQAYPGRKTVILVSGGIIASDTPGGRPDLGSLGMQVGREAARANTAIYALFLDTSLYDQFGAETRRGERTAGNKGRDRAILARWLEQFTGSAGGALFTVSVGNASPALARIQTELSSYYLLGVEPADEDRDGRTHEVAVKTTQSNVTVRGRRWVMIPVRGAAVPAPVASTPATPSAPVPAPTTMVRRAVPSDVVALADLFDRGNAQAFEKGLTESKDLANVIRGLRQSDSPWPENRRRSAVFALELGLAGLRSDNRDARDEGGRLLAEYHVRVREPAGADAFECAWLVTETTALEGLFIPEYALQFVPRALQRCPSNARLNLGYALVSEQQWIQGRITAAQEPEILNRYEQAMKFPETEPEARVRAARFLYGLGQFDRGLAMLDGIKAPPSDLELRYFATLIRGQLLRASGRLDEAAAAYRAALAAWPGAQSAQVALMTLSVIRGGREDAGALAETIQMAPVDQYDPWWTYWLGDYRAYPAVLEKLRELGR
ncbi:MAG TPA: VWA domain-containing protein [Vicinamibacterales bacterium]|nr:VWA domain-containing protein [Vicinamibacterales bacterium]